MKISFMMLVLLPLICGSGNISKYIIEDDIENMHPIINIERSDKYFCRGIFIVNDKRYYYDISSTRGYKIISDLTRFLKSTIYREIKY